jgi:hypothetical protein
MGLGLASGLNLYATVLTVGLGIRLGVITLNAELSSLDVLASPYVLVAAAILYLIEFLADKIPWVDSIWDAIHTLIRPLGAALIGATAIGTVEPQTAVIAVLCAGVSLSGHSVKAGTRLLANHSPEPVSNIALSLVEDILVIAGTWLALVHPAVMLVLIIMFLLAFAWFAPKVFRLMRIEYLATLALLKKFYVLAKQYIVEFAESRRLATPGPEFSVPQSLPTSLKEDWENTVLDEDVPEDVLHHLDSNGGASGSRHVLRCAAGKGIKRLRHSVGYLQISEESLVFVTKRFFRLRSHQIDRNTIEDVHFKRRILLDRLIIRAGGKQLQFYFFKDAAGRGRRAYELLKIHKKSR